jgi:hypothetical protein
LDVPCADGLQLILKKWDKIMSDGLMLISIRINFGLLGT